MDSNTRESRRGPSRRHLWLALPAAALLGLCFAATVVPYADATAWAPAEPVDLVVIAYLQLPPAQVRTALEHAAARLHPHDRQRILRALQVKDATGIPLSDHHRHGRRRAADRAGGWCRRHRGSPAWPPD